MNKYIILLVSLLGACTFNMDGTLKKPSVDSYKDKEGTFIEWQRATKIRNIRGCSVLYLRSVSCIDCDHLEDTLFHDTKIANMINDLNAYMITSDDPQFDRITNGLNIVNIPSVVLINNKEDIFVWDNRMPSYELHNLVDNIYGKCSRK